MAILEILRAKFDMGRVPAAVFNSMAQAIAFYAGKFPDATVADMVAEEYAEFLS